MYKHISGIGKALHFILSADGWVLLKDFHEKTYKNKQGSLEDEDSTDSLRKTCHN